MKIANPAMVLPPFITFASIVCIPLGTTGKPIWNFTLYTVTVSIVLFLLNGFMKSQKQNFTNFTITGDAFIIGTILMIAALSDPQSMYMCLLLLCIPITDIMRFVCREKPSGRDFPIEHKNTWITYSEIALTTATFIVIVRIDFMYPTLKDTVYLTLSAIAFITGFYFMTSKEALMDDDREKYLPMTFVGVPIAMCSPYMYRSIGKDSFIYCIALATVIITIITLDTWRFATRER